MYVGSIHKNPETDYDSTDEKGLLIVLQVQSRKSGQEPGSPHNVAVCEL
jgi:hypothetical protein